MAGIVQSILQTRPRQAATFAELFEIVPDHVTLSKADREESTSRPGEEKWYQIIRNLKAHKTDGFAHARGGLRLTRAKTKTKIKTKAPAKAAKKVPAKATKKAPAKATKKAPAKATKKAPVKIAPKVELDGEARGPATPAV